MVALGLIDGIPDYQLPVARIGRARPLIRSRDLFSQTSSLRELRQSLRHGVTAVARLGQGLDVLRDRRVEVSLALVDRPQSIRVESLIAGDVAHFFKHPDGLIELIVVPEDGRDFKISVALAGLDLNQLVPLLGRAFEIAELSVDLARFYAIAVIGRIDIGHPREYACRLFVELVRLLPERTSQVSKPIRVLRLSGIKRDQLAIRIERFIVMRQPG